MHPLPLRITQMSREEIITTENIQAVWFRNIRNCRPIYTKEKLKKLTYKEISIKDGNTSKILLG
jgi:hypothetical protein